MIFLYYYASYYLLALIGITLGYHRYFSHREFKVNRFVEVFFLYIGLLCGGRSALTWCGVHRMHHAYSDTDKDPHSPKNLKWYQVLFSLWKVNYIPAKFMKDLLSNPRILFFHRYGKYVLLSTYIVALLVDIKILVGLLFVYGMSYLSFGILNLFGHSNNGPINKTWISVFAPLEGNHKDHHVKSKGR